MSADPTAPAPLTDRFANLAALGDGTPTATPDAEDAPPVPVAGGDHDVPVSGAVEPTDVLAIDPATFEEASTGGSDPLLEAAGDASGGSAESASENQDGFDEDAGKQAPIRAPEPVLSAAPDLAAPNAPEASPLLIAPEPGPAPAPVAAADEPEAAPIAGASSAGAPGEDRFAAIAAKVGGDLARLALGGVSDDAGADEAAARAAAAGLSDAAPLFIVDGKVVIDAASTDGDVATLL